MTAIGLTQAVNRLAIGSLGGCDAGERVFDRLTAFDHPGTFWCSTAYLLQTRVQEVIPEVISSQNQGAETPFTANLLK